MVTYCDDGKFAFFDGMRFCRDDKTGYYLNSTTHKRLHRCVYEKYNGEIPKGLHVHHIDHDKRNNEPENLQLLTPSQHLKRHGAEMSNEQREAKRKNMLVNAVPASLAWRKSEKAHDILSRTYQKYGKYNLHARKAKICKLCGEEFSGTVKDTNVFCSNKCKSAWRRKEGLDDEQRVCIICGKTFTTNRYAKTKCCSRSCANRLQHKNRGHKTTSPPASL